MQFIWPQLTSLQYFVHVIRTATTSGSRQLSLADQQVARFAGPIPGPFGRFDVQYPGNMATVSLTNGARAEWNKLEEIFKSVFARSHALTKYF